MNTNTSLIEAGRLREGAVLVIGGGLAGCSAALALARRGTPVVLLEAKSRLGGRVGSYTDPTSQQRIDYCQHVGMGCCTYLRQLIEWLNQQNDWTVERELFFYGPEAHARRTLRALPLLPAPLHLSGWLWSWPGLTIVDRARIARGMLAINRIRLASTTSSELDQQSAYDWLVAHGQSPSTIKRFWSTIIVSALGEELERVGVLPMAKVFQDGFLRRRDAYHLLLPKLSLDELFGQRMAQALAAAGAELQMNQAADGIEWRSGRPHRIHLTENESIDVSAGRVIVAVPWHAWPGLIKQASTEQTTMIDSPAVPQEIAAIAASAASLSASPISGVHTWWDRAWLPTRHAVLVDRSCQWVFPKIDAVTSNPSSEQAEHYYQIVISASRGLPRGEPARVRELIVQDLASVFPEARSAKLLRFKVVTDPQAVFSVRPGVDQIRPPCGKLVAGLAIAGDWARTGWPATMEGAIRSGIEAAQAVTERPA